MQALTSYLRKASEQNPSASYYNVDILKYQVSQPANEPRTQTRPKSWSQETLCKTSTLHPPDKSERDVNRTSAEEQESVLLGAKYYF